MTEMYCFRCLVANDVRVLAVTAFIGTTLCAECAHREERVREQTVEDVVNSLRL